MALALMLQELNAANFSTGNSAAGTVLTANGNGGAVMQAIPASGDVLPVGTVVQAPTNPNASAWLELNNTEVARASYPLLSAAVATFQPLAPWTLHNVGASGWRNCVWTGSQFVTIGYNSANTATSPDGVTWTVRTNMPSTGNRFATVYGNGKIITCATGSAKCAISTDNGVNWSESLSMPASRSWNVAAYSPVLDRFVVLPVSSNKGAYSTDGSSWTELTVPYTGNWSGLVWNGSVFVAWAASQGWAYSADGISWTGVAYTTESAQMQLVTNESGVVYSAGYNAMYKSTDNGLSWTFRQMHEYSVSYGSMFARDTAVGCWNQGSTTCTAMISTDGGDSFTRIPMPQFLGQSFTLPAWNGSYYVQVCNDGTVMRSYVNGATNIYLRKPESVAMGNKAWIKAV